MSQNTLGSSTIHLIQNRVTSSRLWPLPEPEKRQLWSTSARKTQTWNFLSSCTTGKSLFQTSAIIRYEPGQDGNIHVPHSRCLDLISSTNLCNVQRHHHKVNAVLFDLNFWCNSVAFLGCSFFCWAPYFGCVFAKCHLRLKASRIGQFHEHFWWQSIPAFVQIIFDLTLTTGQSANTPRCYSRATAWSASPPTRSLTRSVGSCSGISWPQTWNRLTSSTPTSSPTLTLTATTEAPFRCHI